MHKSSSFTEIELMYNIVLSQRYIIKLFNTCLYCEMITGIGIVNI